MPKHQLCRNCGHIVQENYCPACGQRTTTHRLGWTFFVESFTSTFIGDEAYGLRGINMRKGAVMTWLEILVRPHRVIAEFIEGHRRKYFNPVAILLLLSTFYAVVFQLVGKVYTPTADDSQPLLRWLVNTYVDYATLHPAGYLLTMLPFFALAAMTVFRRKADLRYVEYVYIGIFLSIFEITLMIAALPMELLLPWYSSFYMSTLPTFLYTAFVFWKIFGLRKRGAMLRTLFTEALQYLYIFLITLILSIALIGGLYLADPTRFNRTYGPEPEAGIEAESGDGNILKEFVMGIVEAVEETDDATAPPPAADSLRTR